MLKEGLIDKATVTIKENGIEKLHLMIETLKKKYDNNIAVRANVIKRLSALPAREDTRSSETVFDEIRSLVNEMTSSGYAISDTHDPVWIETIFKRLPRNIVEEFSKENKGGETYTVGETVDHLKVVIMRNGYVMKRLGYRDMTSPRYDAPCFR